MTAGIISIKQFVDQNIIYCVSALIYELTQKACLDEEVAIELWQGSIDWEAAEYELKANNDLVFKYEGYFGVKNEHGAWRIDPIYNDEEQAITEWFEIYHGGDLEDYRCEVYEHHLITPYMARKLIEEGETVVELYDLHIWCRTTTGMSYTFDHCIVSIYNKLISDSTKY